MAERKKKQSSEKIEKEKTEKKETEKEELEKKELEKKESKKEETEKSEKEKSEKDLSGKNFGIGNLSIEEAFEKLDTIINSLNREEISLEDSFHLYEEGVKLLKYCNAKVDKVEKQIIVLNGAENQDEF